MSLRDCSWFLAGVLVTVALTMVILRPWDSTTVTAPAAPSASTASAMQAAEAPHANGDNAGSLDQVTQRLAARLAATGGSDSEWMLLAQSYDYMGRTAEAAAARSHMANAPLPGANTAASTPALDSQTMTVIANALDK